MNHPYIPWIEIPGGAILTSMKKEEKQVTGSGKDPWPEINNPCIDSLKKSWDHLVPKDRAQGRDWTPLFHTFLRGFGYEDENGRISNRQWMDHMGLDMEGNFVSEPYNIDSQDVLDLAMIILKRYAITVRTESEHYPGHTLRITISKAPIPHNIGELPDANREENEGIGVSS